MLTKLTAPLVLSVLLVDGVGGGALLGLAGLADHLLGLGLIVNEVRDARGARHGIGAGACHAHRQLHAALVAVVCVVLGWHASNHVPIAGELNSSNIVLLARGYITKNKLYNVQFH